MTPATGRDEAAPGIISLAYVGIEAADPAGWGRFATDVVGAQLAPPGSDGTQFIRFDDRTQRVVVHPGADGRLAYLGWDAGDAENVAALVRRLKERGLTCEQGTSVECATRRLRGFAWLRDPAGNRIELCYGSTVSSEPFRPSRADLSGFVALGHLVLGVRDREAVERFYVDALGFKVTDYMEFSTPNRPTPLSLVFLRCADRRNHSIALFEGDGLDHLMVEVREIDDVGRTLSLCHRLGIPVRGSLGRHSNDLMISFYMTSPSGLRIEYGCGGTYVDDATWQVRHLTTASLWGHGAGRI